MRVISIKNIVRKDVPIYYRLFFTGVAELELTRDAGDYRIDFVIEIKPTGQKEITVTLLDDIHYPLLPVITELKKTIETMHSNGVLPE